MEYKTIFAGFGGQGIITIGKMLAHAGMKQDRHVTFYPSYGAAMRGGTANCSVIVSDGEIASPIIADPNVLCVLNEPSLVFFQNRLESGGTLLINESLVGRDADRDDVKVHKVPANTIAENLGNGRATNFVMLGAMLKSTGILSLEVMLDVLEKTAVGKLRNALKINTQAIKRGYNLLSN